MPTTSNQVIAENIARGFACGDCNCADDKLRCADRGCADLRQQIERALNTKDRICRKVCPRPSR